jgi:hypothetical protein
MPFSREKKCFFSREKKIVLARKKYFAAIFAIPWRQFKGIAAAINHG